MAAKANPKNLSIDVDSTTNQASLARILGLTVRRISQLSQDGVLQPLERGKYCIADNIQRYIRYLTKDAVKDEDLSIERQKRIAEADLKKHKAEMAELQLKQMKLQLYDAEDIEAVIGDIIYSFRGNLMAMPGRLAVELVGVPTSAEMSKIILAEVSRVLEDLARYQYDPKVFRDRMNARMQKNLGEDESDEG